MCASRDRPLPFEQAGGHLGTEVTPVIEPRIQPVGQSREEILVQVLDSLGKAEVGRGPRSDDARDQGPHLRCERIQIVGDCRLCAGQVGETPERGGEDEADLVFGERGVELADEGVVLVRDGRRGLFLRGESSHGAKATTTGEVGGLQWTDKPAQLERPTRVWTVHGRRRAPRAALAPLREAPPGTSGS